MLKQRIDLRKVERCNLEQRCRIVIRRLPDGFSFVIDAGNYVLALRILLLAISRANPAFETITGEARKSKKSYVAAPLMPFGLSRNRISFVRARHFRPVAYATFAEDVTTLRIAGCLSDVTNGTNPRHLSSRIRSRGE